MLSRRDFLGIVGGLFSSCSRSHYRSDGLTAQVGCLYLNPNTPDFQINELQRLARRVQANFESIGIAFEGVEVFRGRDFPDLRPLDILICFLDEEVLGPRRRNGKNELRYGKFGLNKIEYDRLREVLKIPYNINLACANMGYIIPANIETYIQKSCVFFGKRPDYSPQALLKTAIGITTHEVGHGLGASHVESRTREGYSEFMGFVTPYDLVQFSPINIQSMHSFIRCVQSNPALNDPGARRVLRKKFWNDKKEYDPDIGDYF